MSQLVHKPNPLRVEIIGRLAAQGFTVGKRDRDGKVKPASDAQLAGMPLDLRLLKKHHYFLLDKRGKPLDWGARELKALFASRNRSITEAVYDLGRWSLEGSQAAFDRLSGGRCGRTVHDLSLAMLAPSAFSGRDRFESKTPHDMRLQRGAMQLGLSLGSPHFDSTYVFALTGSVMPAADRAAALEKLVGADSPGALDVVRVIAALEPGRHLRQRALKILAQMGVEASPESPMGKFLDLLDEAAPGEVSAAQQRRLAGLVDEAFKSRWGFFALNPILVSQTIDRLINDRLADGEDSVSLMGGLLQTGEQRVEESGIFPYPDLATPFLHHKGFESAYELLTTTPGTEFTGEELKEGIYKLAGLRDRKDPHGIVVYGDWRGIVSGWFAGAKTRGGKPAFRVMCANPMGDQLEQTETYFHEQGIEGVCNSCLTGFHELPTGRASAAVSYPGSQVFTTPTGYVGNLRLLEAGVPHVFIEYHTRKESAPDKLESLKLFRRLYGAKIGRVSFGARHMFALTPTARSRHLAEQDLKVIRALQNHNWEAVTLPTLCEETRLSRRAVSASLARVRECYTDCSFVREAENYPHGRFIQLLPDTPEFVEKLFKGEGKLAKALRRIRGKDKRVTIAAAAKRIALDFESPQAAVEALESERFIHLVGALSKLPEGTLERVMPSIEGIVCCGDDQQKLRAVYHLRPEFVDKWGSKPRWAETAWKSMEAAASRGALDKDMFAAEKSDEALFRDYLKVMEGRQDETGVLTSLFVRLYPDIWKGDRDLDAMGGLLDLLSDQDKVTQERVSELLDKNHNFLPSILDGVKKGELESAGELENLLNAVRIVENLECYVHEPQKSSYPAAEIREPLHELGTRGFLRSVREGEHTGLKRSIASERKNPAPTFEELSETVGTATRALDEAGVPATRTLELVDWMNANNRYTIRGRPAVIVPTITRGFGCDPTEQKPHCIDVLVYPDYDRLSAEECRELAPLSTSLTSAASPATKILGRVSFTVADRPRDGAEITVMEERQDSGGFQDMTKTSDGRSKKWPPLTRGYKSWSVHSQRHLIDVCEHFTPPSGGDGRPAFAETLSISDRQVWEQYKDTWLTTETSIDGPNHSLIQGHYGVARKLGFSPRRRNRVVAVDGGREYTLNVHTRPNPNFN